MTPKKGNSFMGIMDSIKNASKKKNDQTDNQPKKKPVKGLAKSVQDILDFEGITENGIIIGKPQGKYCYFSKLYQLVDSNFVTEPEDKQWEVLAEYTKFVNRFPDNVDINIIIVNKRNTMSELINNFHIEEQGDSLDKYRREYNAIIDKKITEGRNDITKDKYIMLTARERSLDDAETTFNNLDLSLNDAIKAINKVGVKSISALERIKLGQMQK